MEELVIKVRENFIESLKILYNISYLYYRIFPHNRRPSRMVRITSLRLHFNRCSVLHFCHDDHILKHQSSQISSQTMSKPKYDPIRTLPSQTNSHPPTNQHPQMSPMLQPPQVHFTPIALPKPRLQRFSQRTVIQLIPLQQLRCHLLRPMRFALHGSSASLWCHSHSTFFSAYHE